MYCRSTRCKSGCCQSWHPTDFARLLHPYRSSICRQRFQVHGKLRIPRCQVQIARNRCSLFALPKRPDRSSSASSTARLPRQALTSPRATQVRRLLCHWMPVVCYRLFCRAARRVALAIGQKSTPPTFCTAVRSLRKCRHLPLASRSTTKRIGYAAILVRCTTTQFILLVPHRLCSSCLRLQSELPCCLISRYPADRHGLPVVKRGSIRTLPAS